MSAAATPFCLSFEFHSFRYLSVSLLLSRALYLFPGSVSSILSALTRALWPTCCEARVEALQGMFESCLLSLVHATATTRPEGTRASVVPLHVHLITSLTFSLIHAMLCSLCCHFSKPSASLLALGVAALPSRALSPLQLTLLHLFDFLSALHDGFGRNERGLRC